MIDGDMLFGWMEIFYGSWGLDRTRVYLLLAWILHFQVAMRLQNRCVHSFGKSNSQSEVPPW
jgi:hypothetical protein